MAKSKRNPKQKKPFVLKKQDNNWIDQANAQLRRQDYQGLVQTCRRVLHDAPAKSQKRADALEYLASAYTMLSQFEEAYQALSQALEIKPQYAHLWYNRGLTGRYTMRLVQATRDFEKAVELETDPTQRTKFTEILAQTREMAESERALRGPGFTLEQLEEQQELFERGIQLMRREKWAAAEQAFRRVIEMGECLPQPRGNLGLTLLMQKKYDEAEAAFKRALDIDPDYDLAKQNLASLPLTRQTGHTPALALREPFANVNNISLTVQLPEDDE
ncbi:MAG: tetratricopeptide repeat protein [Anaerolineae bacterium]|nr:tetratricopeptide repeat protein [Anaerolineae bacterium]